MPKHSIHSLSGLPLVSFAMAIKFVVLALSVALAQCSVVPLARTDADYTSFAYDVADPSTGDFKSQVETRVGGNVAGQYSLLDSDGTRRTVDYTADDVNGFNAIVRKDPALVAAAPVVAAPAVVESSPVIAARTIAAPAIVESSPVIAARAYAAPSVYTTSAVAPSVYAAPAVAAPAVVAARTIAAPTVVAARTVAAPTYYASAPALYAARAGYYAPSAYSYW